MSTVEQLEQRLEAAKARLARLPKVSVVPDGPDYVNLKGHLKNLDRDIVRGKAIFDAEVEIKYIERSIESRKRNAPVPFTAEELKAARLIRTAYGWHRVCRVNVKTVKIHTAFGEQLIPKPQILEVRA